MVLAKGLTSLAEAGMESVAVGKATEQIIKATGGAAGITAAQVGDLSGAISAKTGIDDEAIQSASNLLLTFKNVKDAGEGQAAMFDRATAAAVDLSKAGFGDMSSAAKMLGKALNDPEKGITALSRAGVTFTDQQKEQIKALMKTGDVLGAQKIIMKEVESQVGGVAAATRSPIEAMQTLFGNLQESIGGALLPAFQSITDTVGPVFDSLQGPLATIAGTLGGAFASAMQVIAPLLPPLADVFAQIASTVGGALSGALTTLMPSLTPMVQAFGKLGEALAPLLGLLGPLLTAFQPLIDLFTSGLGVIVPMIASFVEWVTQSDLLKGVLVGVTAGVIALNIAMSLNPIGAVILAIIGLVGAIKWLWDNNETFRTIVTTVWNGIKVVIGAVADWLTNTVWPAIKRGLDALALAWEYIGPVVSAVWDGIKTAVAAVFNWLMANVWPGIKLGLQGLGAAFGVAKTVISTVWTAIKTAIVAVTGWLTDTAWPAIKSFIDLNIKTWDTVKTTVEKVWNGITSFLGGIVSKFLTIGGNIVQGIKDGFMAPWNSFIGWVGEQINKLPDAAKKVLGISSPSTVFAEIGNNIVSGLQQGMTRNGAAVNALSLTIGRDVVDAYVKGMAEKDPEARKQAHATMVQSVQDAYQETLGNLQANVASIKDQMTSFATSVSSSIMRVMDFGAAFSQVGTEGGVSFMDALRLQAEQAKLFADRVRQLVTMGLSQDALQMVLAAGTTAGSSIAQELITGGAGTIAETNELVTATQGAANNVGAYAASSFYGAGLTSAQQTVKAFVTNFGPDGAGRARLMTLMDHLAASMDRSVAVTVTTTYKSVFGTDKTPVRAAGGPVMAGQAYWVGEQGPELLVMGQTPGTIIPNNVIGSVASNAGFNATAGTQVINLRVQLGDKDVTDLVRVELDDRDAQNLQLVLAGATR
jgi:phage-related protein